MRWSFLIIILCFNACVWDTPDKIISGDANPQYNKYDTSGRVLYLQDGDSFVMLTADKRELEVRLVNIDAPEKYQPYSNRSKYYLEELIKGRQVGVNFNKIDRYDRILGDVYVDSLYVNLEMLEAGMAWNFSKYSKSVIFKEAQESAREARRGLWEDADAIAPWEWREAKKVMPH